MIQKAPQAKVKGELAFPDLVAMHGAPGLLHLVQFGLFKAIFKIYYHALFNFCGHDVLHRKRIMLDPTKNYGTSDELFCHVREALLRLMIKAFLSSEYAPTSQGATPDEFKKQFVVWHRAMCATGDKPYVYFSGIVFGIGHLYAIAKQCISVMDTLLLFALFVPILGIYKLLGFANLMRQTFMSYAKFLSSPEAVARDQLANICLTLSSRPFHAVGTDAALEMLQGVVKVGSGRRWDVTIAKVLTGLNFYFDVLKRNIARVVSGDTPVAAPKGEHSQDAKFDVDALCLALAPFGIFDVPEVPRDSLVCLPQGLVKGKFEPHWSWCKPIDFTDELSSRSTPVLIIARDCAKQLLTRAGVAGATSAAFEIASNQSGAEEDLDACEFCEYCSARLEDWELSACECDFCHGVFCRSCILPTEASDARHSQCRVCNAECTDAEAAEAEAEAPM